MIIPKQFLKTIERTGLGKRLFYEMRYDEDGKEIPDFVLNKPAYRKAQDPGHRRELRLRLLARARAVGVARFRLPLRHRARRSPTSSTTTASRTASCHQAAAGEESTS